MLETTLRIIATSVEAFLVLATLAPFIRRGWWWIRAFDFPRVQIVVLGILGLTAGVIAGLIGDRTAWEWLVSGTAVAALVYQMRRILPFTPLWSKEIVAAGPEAKTGLRLLIANVRFDNRDSDRLFGIIRDRGPDVALLVEPDEWWSQRLEELSDILPHRLAEIEPEGCGIALLSRLPMEGTRVRRLVSSDRPSLRVELTLKGSRPIVLFGLHPAPPGLEKADGGREDSEPRDAELVVVAREVREIEGPVVVAGDFNDAAWSHTTRLFKRLSGLLDPRVGRGLFNTYHAERWWERFPIDHVFMSKHFGLRRLERVGPFGSDHLGILIEIATDRQADLEQESPEPEGDDRAEGQRHLQEGRQKAASG